MIKSTGTWRSYKTFLPLGKVLLHDAILYTEVAVNANGDLLIKSSIARRDNMVGQKGKWHISDEGKVRSLFINGRNCYEVLTWDKDDLVLVDLASHQKIFLASLPLWQKRVTPKATKHDEQITLWSKSLIDRVKQKEPTNE